MSSGQTNFIINILKGEKNMCNFLVARKFGQIISKSIINQNCIGDDFNNNNEELTKVYINNKFIGKEEKEAFKNWYKNADWYGYDSEEKAMERLNKRGEFKEDVLPEEIVGWYGDIEINIENLVE